jgi:hypothetical protein
VIIWNIFHRFGILCQEKSGNSALLCDLVILVTVVVDCQRKTFYKLFRPISGGLHRGADAGRPELARRRRHRDAARVGDPRLEAQNLKLA